MSTRTLAVILLVMTVLMVASLLTGCTTTTPGHGTAGVQVSDDCRGGADRGDPPWWPLCSDSD